MLLPAAPFTNERPDSVRGVPAGTSKMRDWLPASMVGRFAPGPTTATKASTAGNWVPPSIASFRAAAASADWANAKDFHLVITNAPGADAWPIAATNFILVSKAPGNPARARAALDFFKWGYANGDARAEELGYVPLPDALVAQVEAYWAENFRF